MESDLSATSSFHSTTEWKDLVKQFQTPSRWRANWQLVNTLGSYVLLWFLMYHCLAVSYWLVLPLAALTGLFMVRTFIIFHDCGHGSFYKSAAANRIFGVITGLITFTPFHHWRWEHSVHHASSGHLDKRGIGDIWTMTVEEYLRSTRWKRFAYRLARNPFVLFVLGPIYLFFIQQRFPSPQANAQQRASVHWMNFGLAAMVTSLIYIYGLVPYLLIQVTTVLVGGSVGIWLFYVQHQFEDVYWERGDDWDYTTAALQGSSFYKLPRILQWFSGNIGYHHVHHLSARIPNYHLQRCHEAHFQQVRPLTFRASLKSLKFRLWDEQLRKLVSFAHLKNLRRPEPGFIVEAEQAR